MVLQAKCLVGFNVEWIRGYTFFIADRKSEYLIYLRELVQMAGRYQEDLRSM